MPPIGARLNTAADDRGTITLDGTPVKGTTENCDPGADGLGCYQHASYAIFNRQTLALATPGTFNRDDGITRRLLALATKYDAAPTYLMVVNLQGGGGSETVQRKLLETLGVARMSDADLVRTFINNQASIVGVPGSPAGSAFIADDYPQGIPTGAAPGEHVGLFASEPVVDHWRL